MIERNVEMFDTKFKFIQRAKDEVRELVYDYKKCNGCGICVYACPVNAIELGPVHDIAVGLEMPPVTIDHTKCAFCGICFAFCPFNVYEFYINGTKISKDEMPLSPASFTELVEDKCVHCTLCYKVCPTEAITRDVKITRQEIPEKNEGIEGKLTIDREKCNLCGICAEFCEAFRMVEKDPSPEDPMPYEDILFDEEKCDYCKLCEEICPEEAIKVEGRRIEFELKEIAGIRIDQEKCSHCAYCEVVCPYDAIKTVKPIEGRLYLYEPRMYRCDPVGCGACIKVCKHNRVWYVSKEKGRVYFNEDHCVYCGACENACPYDLIAVERESYYTKEIVTYEPWIDSWHNALERIIAKKRAEEPERKFVKEREIKIAEEVIEKREIDKEALKILEEKLSPVEKMLKKPFIRRAIEMGNIETFVKKLRESQHASSKN